MTFTFLFFLLTCKLKKKRKKKAGKSLYEGMIELITDPKRFKVTMMGSLRRSWKQYKCY